MRSCLTTSDNKMYRRRHQSFSRGLDPIFGTLALALLTLWASSADARRVALVIGNDSYQHATPLQNARSDAKAVARTLEGAGFAVTLEQDVTLSRLKAALRTFKAQISGGDEVVFYFSGHGMQFDGINYLIPIDLEPQSQEQVADDAVPLQRVLENLQEQKPRFALAILDACRDNPFKTSGRAIGGRGLAPVTADGLMVFFSAGAGQEALDRLGPKDTDPNGLFTRVLIKEIGKPGVPAEQMLKKVRDQVVELARGVSHEQTPALYDQSTGEFYFVPAKSLPPAAPAAAAGSAAAKAIPRTVASGVNSRVEFFSSLSPTCEVVTYPEVTVTSAPSHGKVTSRQANNYPSYARENVRFDCNKKLVGGTDLLYQSNVNFQGHDEFSIEVAGSMGNVARYTFDIQVGGEAIAQAGTVLREVHSGIKSKIGFMHSLNPDCQVVGYAEITVVKAASHGKVSSDKGQDYPTYTKDNARYDCNRNLAGASELFYQSDADFHGTDSFSIQVKTPTGPPRIYSYEVEVR